MGTVRKTHQRTRSFVPVGDRDRSARSISVTASQLCWLVVLVIVTYFRCPLSLGQTQAPVNVHVGHNAWIFNKLPLSYEDLPGRLMRRLVPKTGSLVEAALVMALVAYGWGLAAWASESEARDFHHTA